MSRNYYSEINLHVVWHTKESSPLLVPDVEEFIHRWLRQRIVHTEGVFVHAIGGTENHAHLCLEIAPTVLISEFIGQLKGASSHDVNQHFGYRGRVLQWQTGYGVVTFGARDRDWVCGYIRNQREHHARGTMQDRLERITHPEDERAQAVAARRPMNGPAGGVLQGRVGLPAAEPGMNAGPEPPAAEKGHEWPSLPGGRAPC